MSCSQEKHNEVVHGEDVDCTSDECSSRSGTPSSEKALTSEENHSLKSTPESGR